MGVHVASDWPTGKFANPAAIGHLEYRLPGRKRQPPPGAQQKSVVARDLQVVFAKAVSNDEDRAIYREISLGLGAVQ